ncbi:MAG: thioredoxin family protein [Bacteroidales bacterium]|nr:thioredoxin family protein [Bacteroidales bacterium]MDD4385639.1 thioredoxin family protein [Bacteroidales bacterium]
MEVLNKFTPESWAFFVTQNDAVMLYLYNTNCGICNTLRPKVTALVEQKFPKIKLVIINAEENQELAAQMRMLSVPGIILYLEGKEFFRANGLIALSDFELKIRRPYEIMFE